MNKSHTILQLPQQNYRFAFYHHSVIMKSNWQTRDFPPNGPLSLKYLMPFGEDLPHQNYECIAVCQGE